MVLFVPAGLTGRNGTERTGADKNVRYSITVLNLRIFVNYLEGDMKAGLYFKFSRSSYVYQKISPLINAYQSQFFLFTVYFICMFYVT